MKLLSLFGAVVILCAAPPFRGVIQSQSSGSNAAASLLRMQATEESFRKLNSSVDDMWMTLDAQQKQMARLDEKLDRFQAVRGVSESEYVKRDEFDQSMNVLKGELEKLQRQREQDYQAIMTALKELKTIQATPATVSKPPRQAGAALGYYHDGETLTAILAAYNEQFRELGKESLSLDTVLNDPENRDIKPRSLQVGRKVFIPDPPKAKN